MTAQLADDRRTHAERRRSFAMALPDEFSKSAATAMQRLLVTMVYGSVLMLIYGLITGVERNLSFLFNGVLIPAWCYVEMRKGSITRALIIFSWATWVAAALSGFLVAGVKTPALMVIPPLIMLCAWLQGRKLASLMASASIVVFVALVIAEHNHWLPPPVSRPPETFLAVYILIVAIASVLAILIAEHVHSLSAHDRAISAQLRTTVADLQQSEQELVRANRALHSLLESATEIAIISLDTEGNVTLFNPGAERLLGYSRDEMLGKFAGAYIPDDDIDTRARELSSRLGRPVATTSSEVLRATIESGAGTRVGTYLTKTQNRIRVSVVTSIVRDDHGQPTGLLSIARDVTPQLIAEANLLQMNLKLDKLVEERTAALQSALDDLHQTRDQLVQSEKLASLGSLVAAVAHELNTPIGNCVVVSSTLDERIRKLSEEIEVGAVRKSSLTTFLADTQTAHDVLERNLEKLGRLVSSFRQVAADPRSLAHRCLTLGALMDAIRVNAELKLRGLPYVVSCSGGSEETLCSFPEAIINVIDQLLENAVVHAFNGRDVGAISITAAINGTQLELRIADNGTGMNPLVCQRAFDPFFTTRLGQGTSGLGLYICYNLVTGPLAGSIQVASEPGTGTEFTLRLPTQIPNRDTVRSEHAVA